VKAVVTGIGLEPDPKTLSGNPEVFSFMHRILVGRTGSYGEEPFDLVVCSPEWLAKKCEAALSWASIMSSSGWRTTTSGSSKST
jgi:hypothetical protein